MACSTPRLFRALTTRGTSTWPSALQFCCASSQPGCIPAFPPALSCFIRLAAPPGSDFLPLRSIFCPLPSLTAATFCARSALACTATCPSLFLLFSSPSVYSVSGKAGMFGERCSSACVSFVSRPCTIPLLLTHIADGERFLHFSSLSSVSCPRRSTFLQLPIDRFQSPAMMPLV